MCENGKQWIALISNLQVTCKSHPFFAFNEIFYKSPTIDKDFLEDLVPDTKPQYPFGLMLSMLAEAAVLGHDFRHQQVVLKWEAYEVPCDKLFPPA